VRQRDAAAEQRRRRDLYDAYGEADLATDLVSDGPQELDLSSLGWWTTDLRVRIAFTSDGSASPVLANWTLDYTTDSTAPTTPGRPIADPNPCSGTVDLTWNPSTDAGGWEIDHYEVQVSSDGGSTWTSLDDAPAEASSVDRSEGSYVFRVRAVDPAGNISGWSPTSAAVIVDLTAPGAPGAVTASPNPSQPGEVTLTWAAATDGGGAGLFGYVVQVSSDGGENWADLDYPTEPTLSFSAEEGRYLFQVQAIDRAENVSDWSQLSAELIVDGTAPSVPGAPSATPSPSKGSVTVSWSGSTDAGGSDVASYELEGSTDAGSTWALLKSGAPTSQTLTLTQASYRLRVRAVDGAGNASDWSAETPLIVDTTAPAAPGKPVATPNPSAGGSVMVHWTASTDAGGSGLGNYTLEVSKDNGSTWLSLTSLAATIHNYSPTAGRYLFRVKVADLAGNVSAWSASSDELLVDTSAPSVPGQPVAAPNPSPVAQVRLAWSASTDDGAGLKGYVLEMSSDAGSTWSSLAAPAAPEHAFTPAQGRYVFRVAAVDTVDNQSAWSLVSAELVVDGTAPIVPTALAASPSPANAQVTVSWSGSTDSGGSGLAGYSLEISADAGSSWAELTRGMPTSHVFSPDQGSYQLRVRAFDSVGNASAWSTVASLVVDKTAPSAPGKPIAAPAVSAGGSVSISWAGSTDSGGSGLSTYELEASKDGAAWAALSSLAGTSYSFGPTQGSYQLRVRALDHAGNASAWSPLGTLLVDTTPPPAPGRPVGTPNPSAGEPIALSWTASVDAGGSNVASYRLQRSPDGTTWTTIANPTTNGATDPVGSGTWRYRVAAVDGAGNVSGWSEVSAPVVVSGKPVANDGNVTTEEDTPAQIALSASDPDGDALTFSAGGLVSGSQKWRKR
jgi:hypothetical protein